MEVIDFGKFKGRPLSDPEIKVSYLTWIYKQAVETAEAVQAELTRREQLAAGDLRVAERLIVTGYRALAKQYKNDPNAKLNLEGAYAAVDVALKQYFTDNAKAQETKIRVAKEGRDRAYAMEIIKDKNADADDVAWARKILRED